MNELVNTYLSIINEQVECNYYNNEQTLFLICGVPGSGKSTIAEKIKEEYVRHGNEMPDHFEADMFFYKNGEYKFNPKLLPIAHKWCQDSARRALNEGKTVIVSNTSISVMARKPYIMMAKAVGAKIKIIEATGNYKNIHNVPDFAVDKMRNSYVPFSENELISEQAEETSIKEVDKETLKKMLDNVNNLNKRADTGQIKKLFDENGTNLKFYVLTVNNILKAAIVIQIKNNNICFIREVAAFEQHKGYGKKLIDYFLNKPYRLIYLSANWKESQSLIYYYKNNFPFSEYINPRSGIHWFYKNRTIDFKVLENFIKSNFF